MKLVGGDWIVAMATPDRDALLEALEDALNRYEAAGELDNTHHAALRAFAEILGQE